MLAAGDKDEPVEFVLATIQWLYSDAPLEEMAALASFPIVMESPINALTFMGTEELLIALAAFRKAAKATGVAAVRSEVVSLSSADEGLVVVSLLNHRSGADGEPMGVHAVTYVVVWEDPYWRIRSITVGDVDNEPGVRARLEEIFHQEFITGAQSSAEPLQDTPPGGA